MDRLLILACSQRKSSAVGRVSAIDRYDGPAFRVLRKFLREMGQDGLCVLILSAEHGLIAADEPLHTYEHRMSRLRAAQLRPQVERAVSEHLKSRPWGAIAICAGKDYRIALGDAYRVAPAGIQIQFLDGGLGLRLTRLRDWLRESPSTRAEDGPIHSRSRSLRLGARSATPQDLR